MNNNLTDEQQKLVDQYADEVLGNVLGKIAPSLTDTDMEEIMKLDLEDDESGKKVKAFLASRVPNIDTIIYEEIQDFKRKHV